MFSSLLLSCVLAASSFPDVTFDTTAALSHMHVLASDDMRGRHTPSPELKRSASYIAETFKELGVEPVNGSYFHPYGFDKLDIGDATDLTLTSKGIATSFVIKSDYNPYDFTGEGTVTNAPVVFVGYGITAPVLGYDDYAGIDVTGAVVVVIRGEPTVTDSTKPFSGSGQTSYASTSRKIENAKKHGAVGMFVVDAARSTRKLMVLGGRWPSLFPEVPSEHTPIALHSNTPNIPCIHIGELPAHVLFGSRASYATIVAEIDSLVVPQSRILNDITVSFTVALKRTPEQVDNVAGIIRGEEYPDEYVIIGAHYDHVGVGKPIKGDSIFNGADDNASGTTGLLMIAKALHETDTRPERSIVLVAFSGEERGLLGSKAYAANSPLPLEKCVAMINMDMIGRCESNKLSIGGNGYCPDLVAINEEENASLGKPFTLKYDIDRYFFRSDQASFARKRIPVLFYFTGEHQDYHKVTDEISLIKFADMMNVVNLAMRTAWRAADQPRTRYVGKGWED